jgi:hypothetical protein
MVYLNDYLCIEFNKSFMENAAALMTAIESKIKQLIDRQNILQELINENKKQIEELTQIREDQRQTIKSLEEKIKILRIAKTTEIKEGAVNAKLKINELVREIDKCIGLLKV